MLLLIVITEPSGNIHVLLCIRFCASSILGNLAAPLKRNVISTDKVRRNPVRHYLTKRPFPAVKTTGFLASLEMTEANKSQL